MINDKTPLLEMKNIKKDFFGNQVLSDINLTLHAGEVLGLCGENGAGKSTTLKLLSGLKKPYRGDITVSGTLGMLPQNPQTLFVKKTVREDLFEIFSGGKLPREEQERRVARMAALCRLEALLDPESPAIGSPEPCQHAQGRALSGAVAPQQGQKSRCCCCSRTSSCWTSPPRALTRSSRSFSPPSSTRCWPRAFRF